MFSPWGASVENSCVQFLSTVFLMVTIIKLLGWLHMNSNKLIIISSAHGWPALEKCLPTVISCLACSMSLKWTVNLSLILNSVWPMYCNPHLLHVIAYMRYDIFLQSCSVFMALHLMVPVLFRSLQNFHPYNLQRGKPCSVLVVHLTFPLACTSEAQKLAVMGVCVWLILS